jgi:hypothetical protein
MHGSVRKTSVLLGALIAAVSMSAHAANPKVNSASTSLNPDHDLVCTVKLSGLGNTSTLVDGLCRADAEVEWVCVTNSGKIPNAANKRSEFTDVSASGLFQSGRNGSVTMTLTAEPQPPSDFSCPSGQRLRLNSVSYTNVEFVSNYLSGPVSLPSQSAGPFYGTR